MNILPRELKGETVNGRLSRIHEIDNFYHAVKEGDVPEIARIARLADLGRSWQVSFLKANGIYTPENDFKYCMSDAEKADVTGNYIDAIMLYEHDIYSLDCQEFECYLNLAHLYWRCIPKNPERFLFPVPSFISCRAHQSMNNVLEKLSTINKYRDDYRFWQIYYRSVIDGMTSKEIYDTIIRHYSSSLTDEMCFVAYPFKKDDLQTQIDTFLSYCNEYPTAKNKYIQGKILSSQDKRR